MESVEILNKRLIEYYGVADDRNPIWRIVWSDDQIEKRLMDVTDAGVALLTPEWRYVPRYRQWIEHKYVLERYVVVPEINAHELTTKLSYEPIWAFQDGNNNPLPPIWFVTQFVIDLVMSAQGKSNMAKYVPTLEQQNSKEGIEARVKKTEEELFGNETTVGDALAHKEAIVVP